MTGSAGAEGHAGRFQILALILAAQTIANVGPLGIPAIASLIRADLGLTLTQAGSFLSAYYVGPILMSLPAGTLADRWGVKQMLVLGQVVIALGLVAVATAGSFGVLIVLMVFAGFGYGMLNPTSTKAVMGWSPPHQRATVVGLKQVGLPFGGMLGAALLPALSLALGWRLAVAVSGALIALGAVASLAIYRDAPDYVPPTKTPGERSPVSAVLRNRDLWLVALSTLIFAAMQTVWMAFLALYLQGVVGLTLLGASRYLALAQLGGMTGRVVFGVLSDRTFGGRRRTPLAIAGCGSALCSLAIAYTGEGASALWLTSLALVFGFAGIGWNGVQHTLMAELASPRAAGTAVGLGLAVSSLGVTLGPLVFGACVEWAGGYRGPWIALALVMAGGLLLLAQVRERPRLA
ncbi:MAG: MFS transporter [Candidatus Rokubacteria bacterium]|nr:MFS transporter [Candidatus Rokubacteria bacterium]